MPDNRTLIYTRNMRGGVSSKLIYGDTTNSMGHDETATEDVVHKVVIPDNYEEVVHLERLVSLFPCPQDKINARG